MEVFEFVVPLVKTGDVDHLHEAGGVVIHLVKAIQLLQDRTGVFLE